MILEDGDMITTTYLPRDIISGATESAPPARGAQEPQSQEKKPDEGPLVPLPEEGVPLDEVEMSLVRQALERSGGNQTRAAELLRISRGQLRYRLKKLEEEATTNH
jgi:DNA-binding NtrC family response regulator